MLESKYKTELDRRLRRMFPGCVILKNDANFLQGIPDRLVLFEDRWAVLEGKRSKTSSTQPNQVYYVELLDQMSFGRFVYPENEEETLNDLQQAFFADRSATRFS